MSRFIAYMGIYYSKMRSDASLIKISVGYLLYFALNCLKKRCQKWQGSNFSKPTGTR